MRIAKANAQATEYACKKFHYAKSVPAVQWAYNIYNDTDEWCGVVAFGSGSTPMIGKPFELKQGEILELVRVAMNGKQGHNRTSQAVSMALRQLHKDDPLCKMVISYADSNQGHLGTIYQATNWIYLGRVENNTIAAFVVNGKRMHRRSVGAKGGVQNLEWIQTHWDANAEAVISKGKYKYIYPFDKELRKEWLKKHQPYPKKADTNNSEAQEGL